MYEYIYMIIYDYLSLYICILPLNPKIHLVTPRLAGVRRSASSPLTPLAAPGSLWEGFQFKNYLVMKFTTRMLSRY